jgi:uncharacterized damage-inducible protein DinB
VVFKANLLNGGCALIEEIRQIYEYHDWANHKVLDSASMLSASEQNMNAGGSFPTFIEALRHILLVEFLFIHRWQGQPPRQEPEWDTIDQIRSIWHSIEIERNEYLSGLNKTSLYRPIHYTDTRGRAITLDLWQAIFQCVNHSTFHRGQLIEKLRNLGRIPPATDFAQFCT